nr:zinc finger and BTB domain-containing protein 41-like [Aedes albopictus]XP_029707610.1 zinc finger and BTB domain-containing protein 41-like [Aedes albopictus]
MNNSDIDSVCRLCCEKKSRMRSIFEQPPPNDPLQKIILDVARLEVEPEDGLPQNICRTCVITVVKMRDTICSYQANDLKLRQQILGSALQPQFEIKEEEVDLDQLEETCQQDVIAEAICVKQELDEEYLDYERLEEGTEFQLSTEEQKPTEAYDSETDTADEAIHCMSEEKKKEKVMPKVPPEKEARNNLNNRQMARRRYYADNEDPDRPRKNDNKCYVCMSDSFGTQEALCAHLNSAHQDLLPYTCPECVMETVVIKTILTLNSHKKQHLNPEKCPHCDKRYTHKNNLDKHIEMHHSADNSRTSLTCKYCEEVYPSKSSLRHHMKLHTTAVTCEICGKVFKERCKLKKHIQNKHEKLKKFECPICKTKLSTLDSVQLHIKTFHSTKRKCSYCPKKFGSEGSLRTHEKKHLERPDFAPKKEWSDYYTVLDKDKSIHRSYKLKKCKLCGVVTSNIATHLGIQHFPTEYQCKICDMTFKRKRGYVVHVQEHEHGKAQRCPICGREFSERKHLIEHLRTKKHRNHPLAREILSTVRTAQNAISKPEDTKLEVKDESKKEDVQLAFDIETDNVM